MRILVLLLGALVLFLVIHRRRPPAPRLAAPVSSWKIAEKWSIGQGERDGKPIFTRFNLGLRPYVGSPEYAHQLGIAVPLENPTAAGMPAPVETEQLHQIEDEIERRFLAGNESLFAGVVTFSGMREWILYTGEPDKARAKAAELVRDITHHQVQFELHDDPAWENFKRFAGGR